MGTLVGHFYYVIIAIQAYLIFPLLQKLFKKYDKILLLISLVSTIVFAKFIFFSYSDRFIGTYILYFVLGMFFAKYNKKFVNKKYAIISLVSFLLIGVAHLSLSYLANMGMFKYKISAIINIIYVISATIALYNGCKLCYKTSKLDNLVNPINKDSYYIYLYHSLIIFILQNEIFTKYYLTIKYKFIISTIVLYSMIFICCYLKNWIIKKRKEVLYE